MQVKAQLPVKVFSSVMEMLMLQMKASALLKISI